MRPARQSDLACSMRSLDDDTKFHSMKRSPTGSPPSAMSVERAVRRDRGVLALVEYQHLTGAMDLAARLDFAGDDVQRAL